MPQNLRIAYITCHLDVSGVTKINFDILKQLKKNGHEVFVITTHGLGSWHYIFDIFINLPYNMSLIKNKNKLSRFTEYLSDHNVNLIYNTHSYWLYEHLGEIKKALPELKVVDSLHVLEPYCFRGGYPDISANKYVHPLLDKSISISEDLKSYLVKNYEVDEEKITVIRNGIDTKKFTSSKKGKDGFKKELGLGKDSKLIGFIGRFLEQKRPMMFLEIVKRIVSQDKSCFFYMIGSGDLEKKVYRFIKSNGLEERVFIFKQRGDIEHILQSTDLLLAPSLYEGAPLTILEAMSSGTPVISSNVGAIEEYVGDLCELIPLGNEEEEVHIFVEKSFSILDNSKQLTSAIEKARNEYDISKTAAEYEREFLRVLDSDT